MLEELQYARAERFRDELVWVLRGMKSVARALEERRRREANEFRRRDWKALEAMLKQALRQLSDFLKREP